MIYLGCHLSPSAGLLAMGKTALSIGADTLQFFTRNPRGSKAKPIDPDDAAALMSLCRQHHFGSLVAHAPYTLNPCSKDERTREFAHMTLAAMVKMTAHAAMRRRSGIRLTGSTPERDWRTNPYSSPSMKMSSKRRGSFAAATPWRQRRFDG